MWSGGAPVNPTANPTGSQAEQIALSDLRYKEQVKDGDVRQLQEAGLNARQGGYSLLNERLTLAPEFQANDNTLKLAAWFDNDWKEKVAQDYKQGCLEAAYQHSENGRRAIGNWFLSCMEFASADARVGGDYGVARLHLAKFDVVSYLRPVAAKENQGTPMLERAKAERANLNTKADGINQKQGLNNAQNGEVMVARNRQFAEDNGKYKDAEEKLAEARRNVPL